MMLAPSPDLPDDTEIKDVQLPMTIGLVLKNAGIMTVGEVRNPRCRPTQVSALRTGHLRVAYRRKTLGGPFGL